MEEFCGEFFAIPVTTYGSKFSPFLNNMVLPIASADPNCSLAIFSEMTTELGCVKAVVGFPSNNGNVKTEKKLESATQICLLTISLPCFNSFWSPLNLTYEVSSGTAAVNLGPCKEPVLPPLLS